MKRVPVFCCGFFLVLTVFSDIAIDIKSGGIPILRPGEAVPGHSSILDEGSLVQLVWSQSAVDYQVSLTDVSLARLGEYVLFAGSASLGGTFSFGVSIFSDVDVGGVDIGSGFFWVRLWETTGASCGDWFLEMGLQSPVLKSYSVADPASVYSENLNDLGVVPIDAQGVQCIPEPGTAALIVMSGVGLYLGRRRAHW